MADATTNSVVNWSPAGQVLSWQRDTQPLPSHCLPLAVGCLDFCLLMEVGVGCVGPLNSCERNLSTLTFC